MNSNLISPDNIKLPIGTLCTLNDATEKVMIVGFLSYDTTNKKEPRIYDYVGIPYPFGLESEITLLFDCNSITKVDFMGYVNDFELKFKKQLLEETNANCDFSKVKYHDEDDSDETNEEVNNNDNSNNNTNSDSNASDSQNSNFNFMGSGN